jgi:DNA modification methylase
MVKKTRSLQPWKPKTSEIPALRLEWIEAETLDDNPRNWRRHPAKQMAALTDVIREVGWAGALLYNERTGRLLDGHARKKLGGKVPVLIGSWTEEQERTILATLDPLAAMAEADGPVLEALLREVDSSSANVHAMLADLARDHGLTGDEAAPGRTDPDNIPEPPDQAITQPGDLWLLGNHRLLCGDASNAVDVDRLLHGVDIHLVNTDPPYNVKVEPRSNNAIAAGLSSFPGKPSGHRRLLSKVTGMTEVAKRELLPHQRLDLARHPKKAKPTTKKLRAKDRPLANDFVSEATFELLLFAWFATIARVLLPGRSAYIWGGYANYGNYPPVLKTVGLYFSQAIIWDKEHPVLTRKDFMGAHEVCFYCWKEGAAHQFFGPANVTDLWRVKKVNPQSMVHLTEKPVELAGRAIRYSSRPGEHVLDLFGGSGSTLIAAEQTQRRAFLMEIDPLYCDVIVRRWERFTGMKAQRPGCRSNGKTSAPRTA